MPNFFIVFSIKYFLIKNINNLIDIKKLTQLFPDMPIIHDIQDAENYLIKPLETADNSLIFKRREK